MNKSKMYSLEVRERAESYRMPPGLIRLSVGAESFEDLEQEIRRGSQPPPRGPGTRTTLRA